MSFIERSPPRTADGRIVVAREDSDPLLIAIDELGLETKFAVNVGVGTDLRLPLGAASLGVRLEVSDHIHQSPLNVDVVQASTSGHTRLDFGFVHNLRAAAGLVIQLGR